MPSPPKPWERNQGTVTATQPSNVSTTSQSPISDAAPAVPKRPSTMPSSFANRSYGSYGTTGYSPYSSYNTYGSPYNRYGTYSSSYSPYSRYGGYGSYGGYGASSYGGYGASSYGGYSTPYNRFGYGGMMGPGGPDEMSLTQRMEANTANGFHMLESVVNAFGGFAQMLESTFFATHSSFMAMVGVVEQFGNLRNYLGQVLSVFALIRWMRQLIYKVTGRKPPVNPNELTPVQFEQFQEKKYSRRLLVLFVLAVFGIPYLMHRFIRIISQRQQMSVLPPEGNSESITPGQMVTSQNIEFCRALYDFIGESPVELNLRRGDIIAILSKTDIHGRPSQWWRGRLRNGEQGMFPSNYVEIINKGGSNPDGNEVKGMLVSPNELDENSQYLSNEEFENKLKTV
ncbi:17554_t:CDS:2 [Acaulospora morrowiae]|uniref:Peroxisomal membrane protein PEX13 n=1 Tax=Acaulospora morrowiae TaxID=94023 RepID=A0A9N9GYA4_9GLOM|nr:17554_t:CDS:2 [Acaulospora morrowiae]